MELIESFANPNVTGPRDIGPQLTGPKPPDSRIPLQDLVNSEQCPVGRDARRASITVDAVVENLVFPVAVGGFTQHDIAFPVLHADQVQIATHRANDKLVRFHLLGNDALFPCRFGDTDENPAGIARGDLCFGDNPKPLSRGLLDVMHQFPGGIRRHHGSLVGRHHHRCRLALAHDVHLCHNR